MDLENCSGPCWGLSLICICVALQKVPNLFSFMLNQSADVSSHCYITPPSLLPSSKKQLDSQHSSHVLQIFVYFGKRFAALLTTGQSTSTVLYMPISSSTYWWSSSSGGGVSCGFKYPDTNPADHWHGQLVGETVEAWRAATYLCGFCWFWFFFFPVAFI